MVMSRSDIFDAWSPADGAWSAWVKPVLFAHIGEASTPSTRPAFVLPPLTGVPWAPRADGTTALVVDLPSVEGVMLGVELAAIGYRLVPLYNACPTPSRMWLAPAAAALELWPLVDALEAATPALLAARLGPDAPPAFLLDADRRIGSAPFVAAGMYDNRSVSLPTDFPSANLLLSRGIRRVVLVQRADLYPQADLSHTLLRWQDAGIAIASHPLTGAAAPATDIQVTRPPWYRVMWHRFLATAGLKRSPLGGFGGFLPLASAS
jgi:hypothetical protein